MAEERAAGAEMIGRRGFLGGLASLIAAPVIIRAESLMPVKADISLLPQAQWTALYCNRVNRSYCGIEAIRDHNILLGLDCYAGMPQAMFRSIPIRIVDAA